MSGSRGPLAATGTRIGSYASSESTLEEDPWSEVPENAVCIVDRAFFTAATLTAPNLPGLKRHWLTRTRTTTHLRAI